MAGSKFQVHVSGGSRRGSKLFTIVFLGAILGVAGLGVWFYRDTPGQIRHVTERDGLAVMSAFALAMRGVPAEAEQPLLQALERGEPALRAASARALATTHKDDFVAHLGARATTDSAVEVRVAAVEALGELGNGMLAARWISPALDDPADKVKIAACRAVAKLGLGHLAYEVIPLLQHSNRLVINASQEALEKLSGTTRGTDPIAWRQVFEERGGR